MFVVEEGVMEKSTVYRKLERENKTEISSYRHIIKTLTYTALYVNLHLTIATASPNIFRYPYLE